MICYLFSEPIYFFFTSGVPVLLYYAYIPITIIMLFIGFYVLLSERHFLLNRIFFTICILLSFWTTSALIEWTNIHSDLVMFVWSFQGIIFGLVAMLCIYFIYVFLNKKDVSTRIKTIFFVLLAPIFFITPYFYLKGFDITTCDAFKFAWRPLEFYYTLLGILAIVWVFVLLARQYRTAVSNTRKQIVLMGIGIELFLFVFFVWTSIIYYLTEIGTLSDSSFEMYGLLGMLIFMIYISILMVRFKTFNVKLFATQALVWGLIFLTGSGFFFLNGRIDLILTSITFLGVVVFGLLLTKSVKREIEQREHIEQLATQRESFIHFLSHEVKGILGKNKNMFAMILEKDSGTTPEQVESFVKRSAVDTDGAIEMVENILHSNDFKNGKMNMDMKSFDMKTATLEAIESLKLDIETKGLSLETKIDENQNYTVIGDKENITKHVIRNLIDNAIRYTPKGMVNVSLSSKNGKVLFSVKDTGVGITQEDMAKLFTEGGHGKDSIKVNVHSTGYGLFFAKGIVDAHHGRIWAESEGTSKGTTFFLELPVNSI